MSLTPRLLAALAVVVLTGCADSVTAPDATPAAALKAPAAANDNLSIVTGTTTYSFTVPTCNGDSAAITLVGQTYTTNYSNNGYNLSFVVTVGQISATSVKTGAKYTGQELDASGAFFSPTISAFETNTDFVLKSKGLPDISVNQLAVYAQDATGHPVLQKAVNTAKCSACSNSKH